MKINRNHIMRFLLAVMVIIVAGSCRKFADPPLIFEEEPEYNATKSRKVLMISVDGLAGMELVKYIPSNIGRLLENAKYTLEGFSDEDTGDAASWTSIISGKGSANHGVHGNDFEEEINEDDPHGGNTGDGTGFLPIYQRLLETGKPLRTLTVTPWDLLDENLFGLSDDRQLVSTDQEVRDVSVDRIANGHDNLTFVVVNFRSVNDAGAAAGFSMDNVGYKAALDQVDTYIGDVIEAVESRTNYENEDWLIIITSNHGGIGNEYGGATFEERKVPIIFHHKNFVKQEWSVPELGQFARLGGAWSAPVRAVIPADQATAFNFGASGEYTVQLKINLKARGSTWPGFFGKKASTENHNAQPGWSFMFHDPAGAPMWRPHIGHQTTGNVNQMSNRGVRLEEWTTLTMKIYEADGKRYAQCFTDDDKHNNLEITGRNLDNNQPLILGGLPGWISTTAAFDVADIRIYNVALPDEYITNTYCQDGTTPDDPYYSYLIAYWPIKEGTGDILRDEIGGIDFVFERPTTWSIAPSNFCNLPLEDGSVQQLLVNGVDIFPQIFYWLEIPVHDSWLLEGEVFLDRYETEFIEE